MKPVGGCQYEVVLPLAPVGIMYYFEAQELNGKSGITWMSSGRSRIMSLGIGGQGDTQENNRWWTGGSRNEIASLLYHVVIWSWRGALQ